MDALIKKVENWFFKRNLHTLPSDGQLEKLQEEVDELKKAHWTNDREEQIDAVGDIAVVLVGYCLQNDMEIEECLESAYEEIKDRKGYVNDKGIFVKEQMIDTQLAKRGTEIC